MVGCLVLIVNLEFFSTIVPWLVVHILICLNLFLIESGGTVGWLLCPRPNHSWTNMLQLNSMIEIGKGTQIQMFQFIPIYIFRIEILQTIPNGESALVVVRWVLNLNLP